MTHSQSIAIIPYTFSLISILICLFSKTFLDNPKNDPKYCHFDKFLPFSMASFLRSFMLIKYLENKIRRIISTIRRYFSIIIMVSNSKKVVSFINAFKGENELIALVTKENGQRIHWKVVVLMCCAARCRIRCAIHIREYISIGPHRIHYKDASGRAVCHWFIVNRT